MRRLHYLLALTLSFSSGIALLDSALSAAAESAEKIVRVGFVGPASPSTAVRGVAAFWERLRELGWVEGQNLAIETRWAEGRRERLPALMAEVVAHKVDVLVTYTTADARTARKRPSNRRKADSQPVGALFGRVARKHSRAMKRNAHDRRTDSELSDAIMEE